MRTQSHAKSGETARITIEFDKSELHLQETPYGTIIDLDGARAGWPPGAPALPKRLVRIAVPTGRWPTGLSVEKAEYVEVTGKPTLVAPIQKRHPTMSTDKSDRPIEPSTSRPPSDRPESPRAFSARPIVMPDPKLYERALRSQVLARPRGIEAIGLTNTARVEISPVRVNARGHLELCTRFDLVVSHAPDKPIMDRETAHKALEQQLGIKIDPRKLKPRPEPVIVSRAHAKRLSDIARATVLNPEFVGDEWGYLPYREPACEYLIITDDKEWNAATIRPAVDDAIVVFHPPGGSTPSPGDVVFNPSSGSTPAPGGAASTVRNSTITAEFERLAQWKNSRGVSARVVSITDIVAGVYGDFRTGARDLQEVLRRFLQDVHRRWGVIWLLLGGDVEIVPIRSVAGYFEAEMYRADSDPPDTNKTFWAGSFLKMTVDHPGEWGERITAQHKLVNLEHGNLIPYDTSGASHPTNPGWYFTDDSYSARSTTPTHFVRVNGPAWLVNDTLQWIYKWNTIPTDLYYASLESYTAPSEATGFIVPYVYRSLHDWDLNDNGIYGQFYGGGDIDGDFVSADLSVGRAPVNNDREARTFVDKVITYESGFTPDGTMLFGGWTRSVLFASTDWNRYVEIKPAGTPWAEDQYLNVPVVGQPFSILQLKSTPEDLNRKLISDINDNDQRIIPYSTNAAAGRGWYFAKGLSDLSVSEIAIPLPYMPNYTAPVPSAWIVVYGAADEITPRRFVLSWPDQDGSMRDQEKLRIQLSHESPEFDNVMRLYEDEIDLTPQQRSTGPVEYITADRMRAALNDGPHIVSLSGHGSGNGCCLATVSMAKHLKNGFYNFIVFADSCLTNQIDASDSFGETLICNPNGAAVGYVGNTRFGWGDYGTALQRAFFNRLLTTSHLGLLNDVRCTEFGGHDPYEKWMAYTQNLLGCPEMQVRRGPLVLLDPVDHVGL